MFCHGQGNLDPAFDGCCFIPGGTICPNRLKFVNGRVLQGPNLTDLGTTTQWINSLTNNGAARNNAAKQVQGLVYACDAAIKAIVAQLSILSSRATFDAAWEARPEYQPIADLWETIGKPRNWCMTYGPPEAQCCFSESAAINAAKAAALDSTAVTIRRAATGAS